ncbi:hypothetical protein [Arthrobacter bambusae]|uniref:hypothetical protein n=1 Tax=Arthrobacter bambusae TaxID=1338426 RepID=UPI002782046B|nr:hypothetical protein [Arthrobacter bambusae]MDQ0241178.1 hypothetical protein [Arthrobacter bambusae]
MSRIIKWANEMRDLSAEDRARLQRVNCGPDCEYCGFPNRGISIGKIDYFGDEYPDATSIVLDKRAKEWVVYVYDDDAPGHQREAKRYAADEVEVIRNVPVETRLYSHWILPDEADPKVTGVVAYDYVKP